MARTIPPRSLSAQDDEIVDAAAHLLGAQSPPRAPAHEQRGTAARNQNAEHGALFRIQEDGGERPARFYLLQEGFGALTEGQVDVLTEKIESHGGVLTDEGKDADTVITQYARVDDLRRKYWWSRTIYVVEAAFVDMCINSGRYKENLPRPERRGMGGQPVGATRVPFSREDDEHLAEYLAAVIPDEEEGGRGGIEVYRRLVEAGKEFEEFRWAQRHTMWSWRERYSKRRAYFNPLIQHFVEANPPRADGKGLYERSRYFIRGRQLGADEDEEEEEWEAAPQPQEANLQRTPDIARDERPQPQRRSEPGPLRRVDNDMRPPPRKRARHTAPLRRVSSVEQVRGAQLDSDSSSLGSDEGSWEASSAEEDAEREFIKDVGFDVLFANDADAEPSGARQPPGPLSPNRLANSSQMQMRKGKPPSKPASRKDQQRQAARSDRPSHSQAPMSSQATLVAPTQGLGRHRAAPPSTLDGPTQVAEEEEEEEEGEIAHDIAPVAGPSHTRQKPASRHNAIVQGETWAQEPERRRVPAPPPRRPAASSDRAAQKKRIGIVSMPPPPGLFPNADVRRNQSNAKPESRNGAAVAGPSRASHNLSSRAGPSQSSARRVSEGRSQVSARTQEGDEDARHVEELLEVSHGTSMVASAASAGSKHPFEEDENDSDDERMAQNLLTSPALNGANTSATNRHLGQQLPMYDVDFEASPAPVRRASGVQQQPLSSARRASAGRPPSKPLSAGVVPPAALGRTFSMGSETDPNMPMPGTRARQEKTRMRERQRQTPYTPPSGTRAAQIVNSLQLRNREVTRPALANTRR